MTAKERRPAVLILAAIAVCIVGAVASTYGGALFPVKPLHTEPAPSPGYVVFGIDSLSYCQAASHTGDLNAPYEAAAMKHLPGWDGENAGVPGQTLADVIRHMNGEHALFHVMDRAPINVSQRWVVLFGGTNDLNYDRLTAAQAEYRLTLLCRAIRSAGWKVAVSTITPISSRSSCLIPPFRQWREQRRQYNAWIRTNWSEIADCCIDPASDSRLMNPDDRRYFAPDLAHLTNEGYEVLGHHVGQTLSVKVI